MAKILVVGDEKGRVVEIVHRPDGDLDRELEARRVAVERGNAAITDTDELDFAPEDAQVVQDEVRRAEGDGPRVSDLLAQRQERLREIDAELAGEVSSERWVELMMQRTALTGTRT